MIALEESTDLSDIAQLAIFIRSVDKEFTVSKELLALQPLKGTTKGEDIFNEVQKWKIEVNPDKSAAIQFKYGKIRSRLIVDKNTPNLKMLDANIPWQRNYKYLGVTLDKIYTSEIISSVLEYCTFLQSKDGDDTSPVFAHAAPALHRLQDLELPTISKYMKDASKRFFDIARITSNALLRAAVTINRRILPYP
ncbi:General transcription factor II-I repeat domain-containing protein 2A [Eumeta japonica]|uniref:General transcription factor II-I repeat domain-containing protein 2A n=1 Tax=Eumeta variegata TaxID=151549 RepID=A0A4C1T983_EUMVA|nr:General transcription factor II-I repeat domain-containing protein 2A [Eumeta japonica]